MHYRELNPGHTGWVPTLLTTDPSPGHGWEEEAAQWTGELLLLARQLQAVHVLEVFFLVQKLGGFFTWQ